MNYTLSKQIYKPAFHLGFLILVACSIFTALRETIESNTPVTTAKSDVNLTFITVATSSSNVIDYNYSFFLGWASGLMFIISGSVATGTKENYDVY